MLRKLSGFLLAGAIFLSFAACGTVEESPSAPQSPDPPSVSVSPAPSDEPSLSQNLDVYGLPDRDYQPWQEAYMDFLTEQVKREWADILAYHAMSEEEKESGAGPARRRAGRCCCPSRTGRSAPPPRGAIRSRPGQPSWRR